LLAARGLHARKRLGQNFLVDPRFAARVADALPADAFVVEIGAGTGSLTEALAQRARRVATLEIDRGLAAIVRERFADVGNVTLVEGDVLEFDFAGALRPESAPRAICGNLPYYITTPIIEKILDAFDFWESAVLMVQREYARRLTAAPGTPDYSSLTVFVGYHCSVEKIFDVGAAGFYPAPTVSSAVVRLTPWANRTAGVDDERVLLKTIRAAFSQRRKTLANCIVAAVRSKSGDEQDERLRSSVEQAIATARLEPKIRGERLSLDDFKRLANALVTARIDIV
jgi:16S rRNA (adenine1518-N6/adenine1519-N6)-dimethyltransferase